MATGIVKVALGQIDINWEDKKSNKKTCEKYVRLAAARGTDLMVFPEMTLTGFSMDVGKIGEFYRRSDIILFFRRMASLYKINILFGLVLIILSKKIGGNMAVVVNKTGKITSLYQKIHPFSFSGEDKHYQSGHRLAFFKINNLKFSVAICYDLRFPGMFDAIARKKPDAVVVIANWPRTRINHWKMLLPVRALDTQSYIIGVNRVGHGGGNIYNGQSAAFDPAGRPLVKLGSDSKIAMVTLKKDLIDECRKHFTSLRDKKYSLYKSI